MAMQDLLTDILTKIYLSEMRQSIHDAIKMCWDDLQGIMTTGDNGGIFTPHVSEDGILSWTNDSGMPNPDPIKIVGKDGAPGTAGTSPEIKIRSNGTYIQYSTDEGNTWTDVVALTDLSGKTGPQGGQGVAGEYGGANGIAYDPETNEIQLMANGEKVGEAIEIPTGGANGLSVPEDTSSLQLLEDGTPIGDPVEPIVKIENLRDYSSDNTYGTELTDGKPNGTPYGVHNLLYHRSDFIENANSLYKSGIYGVTYMDQSMPYSNYWMLIVFCKNPKTKIAVQWAIGVRPEQNGELWMRTVRLSEGFRGEWQQVALQNDLDNLQTTLEVATADKLGGVKAEPKTDADTVPIKIGEDGKLYVGPIGAGADGIAIADGKIQLTKNGELIGEPTELPVQIPMATADILGGIKADLKTDSDTVSVRIDMEGKLYTSIPAVVLPELPVVVDPNMWYFIEEAET